ncbi:bifunctional tRNA (5-methylaminomethyl-2-thiouridine)(34)-methyltransferase MnmD/FAD-dependent 5-carboxymethylaminomethyl-2-thiouridine(34) oxidoreductase MnmC [Larsenimonas suaedae]|uniref:tRNA 5-methylaminomethyl-2-thiouridine biosynthesis bifunctional protein MnmC n=1 Tax=Larsenimonas suaedae TaxID=1851019 RepID=A0ABU1GVD0_9GAMM|nr:bifunctional tRNA (5-methylaminomethyl-2-thiouridine)(34)-methyltransferase MnmD/FAD-dependent 5-carboxymethylaminomethyl-2-thiouridine(34) oxidoreductase MnmC [Larsenimonas suaedae]MCM2971965.1 bifunctional tRNA (5-methylaminomethyl-2-thiouridine)(34)-methyltransferase MnmD/FAD-dependent 5-carboxymethylaminomethyl-2-thiouridine(34) oxidoreductase MnmC [Larsenimonas suaedae]MDR5895517.1 bifunctional tRNA (5-methylaminomethyl-2-thiouridine)(34)-methyltransferase MnmD/FAD-dependent 5-carboxymeth
MTAKPTSDLSLTPARLDWRETGPTATDYDDVYYSREDGRLETEHVFIRHNDLPERFRHWSTDRPFVIGETGFGSGLNMLCACACFEEHAPATARLHLVSTEKHPFCADDLARAHALWPEFAAYSDALRSQWPEPVAGIHRLWLGERITLDLHFGDACDMLSELDGGVDAWFLDGFAPSKNPDMWQPALFEAMARVSHPGATLATFTCAGIVKRGLKAAGFELDKVAGFGRKREMLVGRLDTPPTDSRRSATPWFHRPAITPHASAVVIGAGLAGATTAHALARRGVKVHVVDEAVAGGGSGNDQGALYIKLAATPNDQSLVYLSGLEHTRRLLDILDPARTLWDDCGVLTLALTDKDAARQAKVLAAYGLPTSILHPLDRETASAHAGQPTATGGLFFPRAGWAAPNALCARLLKHTNITYHQTRVSALTRDTEGWCVALSRGEPLRAGHVVVATAYQSRQFAELASLSFQPVRGQVSQMRVPEDTPVLETVVCGNGYAPPPINGVQSFGASFYPNDTGTELRDGDHATNVQVLSQALPELGARAESARLDGRAALRSATPDKSPYVGSVPVFAQWARDYAGLGKDAKRFQSVQPGAYHPGLWISAGHGSRGLSSTVLSAELLASMITGEPCPLPRKLVDHLNPGRRLISDLIRGTASV